MAAFVVGVPLPSASTCRDAPAHCTHGARTLRAARRHRRPARLSAAAAADGAAPPDSSAAASDDLMLRRKDLVRDLRHVSAVRYRRVCTPADVDMADECNEPVTISVVAQPVRAHFRVRAQLAATMRHTCSRCLCQYDAPVRGSFEVWLSASGAERVTGFSDEEVRQLEAVEGFSAPNAVADLAPHARDALLLAAPSKPLCRHDCPGIEAAPGTMGSVTYGVDARDVKSSGRGVFDGMAADKLSGLRDSLK